MTKEELQTGMITLANAYRGTFALRPNDDSEITTKILITWYEFFKEYDGQAFNKAVKDWIRTNPKAPAISELLPSVKKGTKIIERAK